MGFHNDWAGRTAPGLEAFEAAARAAFDALPEKFRALCGAVVFTISDFAPDDVLAEMEIESPFDLMGLYDGAGVTAEGAGEAGAARVNLYRRPILDLWAEGEETLGHVIAHVLVNEIGHHFGLSDDDMHALEEAAD